MSKVVKHEFVVLDTETTGFSRRAGHVVIEIGMVKVTVREYEDKAPVVEIHKDQTFHSYVNPNGQKNDPDALAVHGITDEFLGNAPQFKDMAKEIVRFIGNGKLIGQNVQFDIRHIDNMFAKNGLPLLELYMIEDTKPMSQKLFPEAKSHSLDAIADRLNVDRSARAEYHGALVDAMLTAEVFKKLVQMRYTSGMKPTKCGRRIVKPVSRKKSPKPRLGA